MENVIIEKMVEDTLYSVLKDHNSVDIVLQNNKEQFYLYAMEYLLFSTISNDVVKIIFKLSDIEELSDVNENELANSLQKFKETGSFKDYLLHNVRLDYEMNPGEFLGWAVDEDKGNEETQLDNETISAENTSELASILGELAIKSINKEKQDSENVTMNLKALLESMLKEVTEAEREALEAERELIEFNEEEPFNEVITDVDYPLTKIVIVEDHSEPKQRIEDDIDFSDDDLDFDDSLDDDIDFSDDDLDFDDSLDDDIDFSDDEESEDDLLGDDSDFDDLLEDDDMDFSDDEGSEDDLLGDDSDFDDSLEDDMDLIDNGSDFDDDSEDDEDRNEAVVDELTDGEYGGAADTVNQNIGDGPENYDEGKYYKIKDDEELQTILQIRRVKNIILFIAIFACFALALFFILFI